MRISNGYKNGDMEELLVEARLALEAVQGLPNTNRNSDIDNQNSDDDQSRDNRIKRRRRRGRTDPGDDGKWRPYWHRGHTTVDEMNEKLREKEKLNVKNYLKSGSSRKTKLYHSNLDLSSTGRVKKKVKISKYASSQGLNRMPPIEGARRGGGGNLNSTRLSHGNSSLNLPNIDPELELTGEAGSRDNSAATSARASSRNGRISGIRDPDEDAESEVEGDVYLSDDDPDVSRQNLDKAGDYIVEHDWILKENLAKEARKVNSKHNKMKIVLPDEDPLETIKSRMDEINLMVKPRAEFGNYLDTIDPAQKEKIVKYKFIDHNEIRKKKRKNWTATNIFQDAVFKIILLYRASHPRRRYLSDDQPDTSPDGVKKIKQSNTQDRDTRQKSSLGFEMQLSLVTQCEYRTEEDIKRVTQILRATKAFKHLFPAQLEEQLARKVAYEVYDGRRIVAQQGRDPERFYYILTGKLSKVREYRLLSGIVTREEGFIEKGSTTDPQEMSQNWPHEHHLVTKGNVEVLIIDKQDFLELLHTCEGPPIDFLQGLDLFKEFPCEEFRSNTDAIDFKYYGQENLIVKDSNRTPWLHVVKTGRVKVVRNQTVIDVQNEDKFSGQTKEDLGCVRPFKHASAMLGLLAKQRKMKTLVGTISFPEGEHDIEVTNRPEFERSRTEYSLSEQQRLRTPEVKRGPFINPLNRVNRLSLVNISNMNSNSNNSSQENSPRQREVTSPKKKPNVEFEAPISENTSKSETPCRLSNIVEDSENSTHGSADKQRTRTPSLRITSPRLKPSSPTKGNNTHRSSITFLPPIQSSRTEDSQFVPHGTYLTRERTEVDPVYKKKSKKDVIQRDTHLQLDVLKPGDIFGLEHMEPQALASEGPGVSLISDGAEIIKISKRFFLQHAKNNTMLKVETMQREYMTPEEAKTVMYNKETWRQYKSVLLQRTVENLHRNVPEKVP